MYEFVARTECPSCGAADVVTCYRSAFNEGAVGRFVRDYYKIDPALLAAEPYQLDRCPQCDLTFQKYVGSSALLADLYGKWIDNPTDPDVEVDTYRRDINAVRLSRDAHEIMAVASFLGVELNALKVLDYGMGWALWARIAARLGCRSFGSDIAEPRMAFARKHGVEAITDDEIAAHRFHFINTEQVFEHVPAPFALLRRLADALAPGGVLKISVPSGAPAPDIVRLLRSGPADIAYSTIMPVQPLEHVNSFTARAIERMAARAGLSAVTPSYLHRFAFLRHRGTVDVRRPRQLAKELVRPWHQFNNPRNLYVWLRKAA